MLLREAVSVPMKYNDTPGPGVEKGTPPAKGPRLFLEVLSREFTSLAVVSCLFLLFSIPVVTIPAAYCAMTSVITCMVRDRPFFLWSEFWSSFRCNFGKATAAGLLMACCFTVVFLLMHTFIRLAEAQPVFCLPMGAVLVLFVLLVYSCFSLFPMIALIDLPLKGIIKNAFLLVVPSLGKYCIAFTVLSVLLLMGYLLFPASLLLVVLLYPGLLCLVATFAAYPGIRCYALQEEETAGCTT